MWRMTGWMVGVVWLVAGGMIQAEVVYDVRLLGSSTSTNPENVAFLGQSFNTGSGAKIQSVNFTSLAVLINGDFTIRLYNSTGTANNYTKSGTALYSATANTSSISSGSLFLNLYSQNWLVNQNTTYILGIESVGTVAGQTGKITWYGNTSSSQTSSTGYLTGFANMNRVYDNTAYGGDMTMTVTVPEPGTLLLGGIAAACGGGGVWWKRRRRPGVETPTEEAPAN